MDPQVGEVDSSVRKVLGTDTLSLRMDSCRYGHLGKHRSGNKLERHIDGGKKRKENIDGEKENQSK